MIHNFIGDESGATVVEYGVIVALGTVCLAAVTIGSLILYILVQVALGF